MKRLWQYLLLSFIFLPLAAAVSVDSLTISPQNATTTNTLTCSVNASGTGAIQANITWFRNNVNYATSNETLNLQSGVANTTSSTGDIPSSATTKGQAWICQATVADATNTTVVNSTNLTIIDSLPVLTFPISTQSVLEHAVYAQNATVFDADGDPISSFISSDLNASHYNGINLFTITTDGLISFTANQSMIGNHTMAILAYDGEGWGGTNVLFTIIDVNDSPVFQPTLSNQAASVGTAFSYIVTATDEEGDPFNFTLSASRPTVTIKQISATQANISFSGGQPISQDQGLIQVNATVYSVGNLSANTTESFTINVTKPDAIPVFTWAPDANGTQGSSFVYYVNATDADINDTINFTTSTSCPLANPWTITTENNNSTDAYAIINLTLTNDNVACPAVTITARDYDSGGTARGGVNSTTVYFNITNTNDPPIIYNLSYNASNTFSEKDLRNLTTATFTPFTYVVNATDPDMLTYAGDTITFTDNTSLFDINASTGVIQFTPGLADVGNHLVNITATDLNGSIGSAVLNITIVSDGYPSVTPIGTITCAEKAVCTYNFTASHPDAPINISFSFNDSIISATQVGMNTSQLNRTYTNNEVGVYTINVSVTDAYLHQNSTLFTLNITNVNDPPFFDNDQDGFADTLSIPVPVVVGFETYWLINASDPDFRNDPNENLTFLSSITSGPNASLFTITRLNATQALINFTPDLSDIGNYTINVTLVDAYGANASQLVQFTISNASLAPTITEAQPYYNGTDQINSTLSSISSKSTTVSFPENSTIQFNLSYTDVDTQPQNEVVRYYMNGTLISTHDGNTPSYTWTPDFFSAGSYNITAVVQDNLLSSDNFTWLVNITNVNRPPVLLTAVPNRTINMTASLSREMAHFLDPDDDLNSNGALDANETNHLTFSATSTPLLSISFTGLDVTLTPLQSGVTDVTYKATDPEGLNVSANVTYIVFYFPNTVSSGGSSSSSGGGGGGGGGGGSNTVLRQVKQPDPYAIDIIVPKPITIYDNETVIAPIAITNTGKVDLHDISLTAQTDANQTVNISWSNNHIDALAVNETVNTTLAISNYKYGGTFEVYVTANVKTPAFNDSAVLYINSIEKGTDGSPVDVRVTAARDLLAATPACGELVQLVNQAQEALKNGDTKSANDLLSAVDEGCTYLKAKAAAEVQNPTLLQTLAGYQYVNVLLGGLLVLLLIVGGLLVLHYGRQQ